MSQLGATNVRDFGAKGDGMTDDSVAIQQAVNSISVTGGVILIPEGVYKANFTINTSNINITGSGTLNGTINLSGKVTSNTDRFSGTGNIRIDGITINGEKKRNGINCKWVFGVLITNVRFIHCLKAINFEPVNQTQHCSRFSITDNQIIDCNYGLYVDYLPPTDGGNCGVGDVNFTNNMYESRANTRGAFGNKFHIWAKGLDGLICKGNVLFFAHTGSEQSNIYIEIFNWVVIEGNNIFESGDSAIVCKKGFNVVISNNNIAWAQKYGVYLSEIVGGIVNANNLTWKSGVDNVATGVYIEKSPYFIGNISNNNIFFPGMYGIHIKDSSLVNITGNNARSQYGNNQAVKIDSPTTCTGVSMTSNQFTNYAQSLQEFYLTSPVMTTNYLSSNSEGKTSTALKGILNEEFIAFTNNAAEVDISNLSLAVFAYNKLTLVTKLTKEDLTKSLPRIVTIYSYTSNLTISRSIPNVQLKGKAQSVKFPVDSSMTLLVYGSKIIELSRNFPIDI
ncbi:glycosyl hydrolase family 28-related protein [Paenibacillus sp. FA6]|uniref:glycosyl hydrolase family 28-related protein n=1 Tax=Paenibacillus sp. FA6 TaxID=3413029 RepID=UPI003F65A105